MKLVPIKSCVLLTGRNSNGEAYHQAKLTLSLDADTVGVIAVSVNRANALPKSWVIADGVKPSISKTQFTRWDNALKSFVPSASAEQADRVESLVSLGYIGVPDEDLKAFAVIRKETGKRGQIIAHLKRTAEGTLNITRLPFATEEAGVEVLSKE